MLSTSTNESQNQAVHLRTACVVLPMENQSSVPGDGSRSVIDMQLSETLS